MVVQAEISRGFLGLTHNPFTAQDDAFFAGSARKTYLEQLRHLSQWSRRVLLVTGPFGIGKTFLYRELSKSLEPRAKAARLNGTLLNSTSAVLTALVQGFGIAAPRDANTELLAGLVTTHVFDQEKEGRFCLAMVDDAHLLDFSAVDELLKLSRVCALRVLLFGEPNMVNVVSKSARHHDVDWHEMRLAGFSNQELRDYLEWRFAQARYRGRLPFTEDQVNTLGKVSEGLPLEVNRISNEYLNGLESSQFSGLATHFPPLHRLLALLLVVVVGLLYALLQDPAQQSPEVAQLEPLQTEAALPDPEVMEGAIPVEEPSTPQLELLAEAQERSPGEEAPADSEGAITQSSDLEPQIAASEVVVTITRAEQQAPSDQRDNEEATAQPVDVPEGEPLEPPASAPESGAVAATERPTSTSPIPVTESTPVTPPSSQLQPSAGFKDAVWLLAQPSDRYTLQLVTVSSEASMQRFINRQRNPSDFAYYTLQRNGRTLYVVTYGIYASLAEANSASERLPAEVGSVKPWVRPLRQVHNAIGT